MTEITKRLFNIGDEVTWRKKIGPGSFYPKEDGKIINIIKDVYVCRTPKGQTWKIRPQQIGGNDILTLKDKNN